jgi:hypothetical protein
MIVGNPRRRIAFIGAFSSPALLRSFVQPSWAKQTRSTTQDQSRPVTDIAFDGYTGGDAAALATCDTRRTGVACQASIGRLREGLQ